MIDFTALTSYKSKTWGALTVESHYLQCLCSGQSLQTLALQILNHRSQGKDRQVLCKRLVTTFSSPGQRITLSYVYFCLKTSGLICIVDSLALNSWPTALWLVPEWSFSNTCISSARHMAASCAWKTLDSTLALSWEIILNSWKAQKYEKCGTKQTTKGHWFRARAETQRRSIASCDFGEGHGHRETNVSLPVSPDNCESTSSSDFGVTDRF